MGAEQPLVMRAGNDFVRRLTFTDDNTGDLLNLDTDVTDIQLQVKAADGDADPALIALSLLTTGIVKLTQSGDTLGQADFTILAASTAAPWVPKVYRYDVVVLLTSGARQHAIWPSDLDVRAVVNLA